MDVFFIYDTAYCKADEDDPKDAILYFFSAQATGNQYSLCCQLAGVAKFLKNTFSQPSVISLDQQKFVFFWSGKYLLVLGGHSDIEATVLKRHLSFLCGMFCFYHGSINMLLKECRSNRKEFLARMELAWSRYITLVQCFGNLLDLCLNPLPLISFRKNSSLVSRASQLLQMCQLSSCVMAGAVFCNSRALASQLTPELTSFLTLMSNANAASPVSNVNGSVKNLPPDVELKYVHLNKKVQQSILKYNHIYVGNPIRIKINDETRLKQTYPLIACDTMSSGSEADVDSGNYSESVRENKYMKYVMQSSKESTILLQNQLKLFNHNDCVSCCVTHVNMYKKHYYKCQNQNYLKVSNCDNFGKKYSVFKCKCCGLYSRMGKEENNHSFFHGESPSYNVLHVNLLCSHHAYFTAESFVSDTKLKHVNIISARDLEFTCCLCVNYHCTLYANPLSFKRWNSEICVPKVPFLSQYSSNVECDSRTFHDKSRKVLKHTRFCKVQILKCRARKDRNSLKLRNSKKHITSDSVLSNLKEKGMKIGSKVFSFPFGVHSEEGTCENLEKNELEKTILYVQRCEISTLVLLLKKNFDEKILTYLWNCGFSGLKDLGYSSEKMSVEDYYKEHPYYAFLYNNDQKVLKEHPQYPPSEVTEKYSKNSVQAIQEDFQSNSDLHLIYLLCANESIFACQTKQYSAFYLQPEFNSRKIETLYNLSKKAVRRLDKFFKFKI